MLRQLRGEFNLAASIASNLAIRAADNFADGAAVNLAIREADNFTDGAAVNLAIRAADNFADGAAVNLAIRAAVNSLSLNNELCYTGLESGAMNMADSVMLDKAKDFAVEIINQCRNIKEHKHESVMTSQLIRSGTSVGANIHESKYAQGTADFIAKMQIALKECYESEYWLELLERTGYINDDEYNHLQNSCGSIRRMLISSINTTKESSALRSNE